MWLLKKKRKDPFIQFLVTSSPNQGIVLSVKMNPCKEHFGEIWEQRRSDCVNEIEGFHPQIVLVDLEAYSKPNVSMTSHMNVRHGDQLYVFLFVTCWAQNKLEGDRFYRILAVDRTAAIIEARLDFHKALGRFGGGIFRNAESALASIPRPGAK